MAYTVVVPLDGSALAERALPYARFLARAGGARVVLVRVVPTTPFVDLEEQQEIDEGEADALHYLGQLEAAGAAGPRVEKLVHAGQVVPTLLEAIQENGADLVAASTHGRTGLPEVIHGSVAAVLIRQAGVPLLLVPPRVAGRWEAGHPLRVLVALDGSDASEAILEPVRRLAAVVPAELVLARVVAPPSYERLAGDPNLVAVPPSDDLTAGQAEQYLNAVAADLRARGQSVTVEAIEANDPAEAIALRGAEDRADLIALATHGQTGLGRLILGSVAAAVVRRATVPVLVARPTELAEGGE